MDAMPVEEDEVGDMFELDTSASSRLNERNGARPYSQGR